MLGVMLPVDETSTLAERETEYGCTNVPKSQTNRTTAGLSDATMMTCCRACDKTHFAKNENKQLILQNKNLL